VKRASIHLRKRKAPSQEANPQPLAWQTWEVSVRLPGQCRLGDRFIRTASCDAVWSNKFWNRKIHGWFRSHFQV